MSKRINVNPDHYKVAGRERMGEPLGQDADKERLTRKEAELARGSSKAPKGPKGQRGKKK